MAVKCYDMQPIPFTGSVVMVNRDTLNLKQFNIPKKWAHLSLILSEERDPEHSTDYYNIKYK